jgi:hypothetical protein
MGKQNIRHKQKSSVAEEKEELLDSISPSNNNGTTSQIVFVLKDEFKNEKNLFSSFKLLKFQIEELFKSDTTIEKQCNTVKKIGILILFCL